MSRSMIEDEYGRGGAICGETAEVSRASKSVSVPEQLGVEVRWWFSVPIAFATAFFYLDI